MPLFGPARYECVGGPWDGDKVPETMIPLARDIGAYKGALWFGKRGLERVWLWHPKPPEVE